MTLDIPQGVLDKLKSIGYEGNPLETGVGFSDILNLEHGTLMRLINQHSGVVADYEAQKEAETQHGNANPQPTYDFSNAPKVEDDAAWKPQAAKMFAEAEAELKAAVQVVEGDAKEPVSPATPEATPKEDVK